MPRMGCPALDAVLVGRELGGVQNEPSRDAGADMGADEGISKGTGSSNSSSKKSTLRSPDGLHNLPLFTDRSASPGAIWISPSGAWMMTVLRRDCLTEGELCTDVCWTSALGLLSSVRDPADVGREATSLDTSVTGSIVVYASTWGCEAMAGQASAERPLVSCHSTTRSRINRHSSSSASGSCAVVSIAHLVSGSRLGGGCEGGWCSTSVGVKGGGGTRALRLLHMVDSPMSNLEDWPARMLTRLNDGLVGEDPRNADGMSG
ncbi:hypothetical protein GSI_12759 [Ganoderma sinense ZZ0214-1]|uniref:Uncharacterized protein n=1 Tax=Ganoderma sinense ZZ0214-1 TaxID=1077348 RepID=A0A2G8RTM5_9APHY|nr:hypothetical protein GSI_12759 [Ganoderma sinense ZZ0214-1]